MKYIIKDKYEGLDPELAELLRQGKCIKGYFWVDNYNERYESFLLNYGNGTYLDGNYFSRENFEPILKEEPNFKKGDLIKITNKDADRIYYRIFIKKHDNYIRTFQDGREKNDNSLSDWYLDEWDFEKV